MFNKGDKIFPVLNKMQNHTGPLCVFKCLLKLPAIEDAYAHWLHLFDFSPLCVFKCFLKVPASADAYSHWLHLFGFSPLCVFKCLLKWPACKDA